MYQLIQTHLIDKMSICIGCVWVHPEENHTLLSPWWEVSLHPGGRYPRRLACEPGKEESSPLSKQLPKLRECIPGPQADRGNLIQPQKDSFQRDDMV